MIKCNVTVCAKITRAAFVRTANDGSTFLSFMVALPIKGHDGSKRNLEISVTTDGGNAEKSAYAENRRVRISGALTVRKKNNVTYFNLRGEGDCDIVKSTEEDSITGTIDFKGKTGKKNIETRTDKRGKPYKIFSAFSSDKNGDDVEFVWVRFVDWNPKEDDVLAPSTYVEVKGDLQLGVFRNEISMDCSVSEIHRWELEK